MSSNKLIGSHKCSKSNKKWWSYQRSINKNCK